MFSIGTVGSKVTGCIFGFKKWGKLKSKEKFQLLVECESCCVKIEESTIDNKTGCWIWIRKLGGRFYQMIDNDALGPVNGGEIYFRNRAITLFISVNLLLYKMRRYDNHLFNSLISSNLPLHPLKISSKNISTYGTTVSRSAQNPTGGCKDAEGDYLPIYKIN